MSNETKALADIYLNMLAERNKKNMEAMDPVGKADGDIDNDGDEDESDAYLKKRRAAIKKSMKKEAIDIEQDDESSTDAEDPKAAKGKKPAEDPAAKNMPAQDDREKEADKAAAEKDAEKAASKDDEDETDPRVKKKKPAEKEMEEAKGKMANPQSNLTKKQRQALASPSARAKSKDKVSLKKAPWDKKESFDWDAIVEMDDAAIDNMIDEMNMDDLERFEVEMNGLNEKNEKATGIHTSKDGSEKLEPRDAASKKWMDMLGKPKDEKRRDAERQDGMSVAPTGKAPRKLKDMRGTK